MSIFFWDLHNRFTAGRVVGSWTAQRGQDHPLHYHNSWELIFQCTGHIRTVQGDRIHEMHPGMVLVHPPNVTHADYADTDYSLIYIQWDAPLDTPYPLVCHDSESLNLGQTCEAMLREWQHREDGWDRMLDLLGERLDLLLRRAAIAQTRTPAEQAILIAEEMMQRRYRETLTIEILSAEAGVSPVTLNRYFTRERSQTPIEYLQSIRLRHVLDLLYHSTLTLEAIADQCGFHSASHLSRHVKAATGQSPGRLRNKAFHPDNVI